MNDYILGIDIGTSNVKVGLLDLSNFPLFCLASRNYDSSAEQSSRMIWVSTLEAIKEITTKINKINKIAAIGITGQIHGTVLYNSSGDVIESIINCQV